MAAMSKEDENSQVFKGTTTEDVRLENLGYEQGEFNETPCRPSLNCILDAEI